jgi:hypothetical protein
MHRNVRHTKFLGQTIPYGLQKIDRHFQSIFAYLLQMQLSSLGKLIPQKNDLLLFKSLTLL